jgi:DNA-binding MarR family transcriptional regulator
LLKGESTLIDSSLYTYELAILFAISFRTLIDDLHVRLTAKGYGDVRPAHGFVFQLLAPDGATGSEIAEHLGITKQAASQMVDFLEQHGYILRQPHPGDGRGKIVVLTERGWNCIHETEAIFADQERQWTQVLGAERMETFREDLRRLVLASNDGVIPRRLRPVW